MLAHRRSFARERGRGLAYCKPTLESGPYSARRPDQAERPRKLTRRPRSIARGCATRHRHQCDVEGE